MQRHIRDKLDRITKKACFAQIMQVSWKTLLKYLPINNKISKFTTKILSILAEQLPDRAWNITCVLTSKALQPQIHQ